jgi:hypothetical protein
MIELYLSISKKLSEVPELKYIDIEGSEEISTSPAAYISLGEVPWRESGEAHYNGDLPFTIKVDITPYHRSAGSTPEPVLTKLTESMSIINAVKDKILKEEIDYISGITITGESFKKQNGKFTALFKFKGYVEYEP